MPIARVFLRCLIKKHSFRCIFAPMYPPGDICGCKWPVGPFFIDFWSIFGVPGAPCRCHLRSHGRPGRHFWSAGPTFGGTRTDFERNIVEKSVFVILVPRLGETTTFEGPAAQVGATWS